MHLDTMDNLNKEKGMENRQNLAQSHTDRKITDQSQRYLDEHLCTDDHENFIEWARKTLGYSEGANLLLDSDWCRGAVAGWRDAIKADRQDRNESKPDLMPATKLGQGVKAVLRTGTFGALMLKSGFHPDNPTNDNIVQFGRSIEREVLDSQDIGILRDEIAAWKERFPQYVYRPQDDCISLKRAQNVPQADRGNAQPKLQVVVRSFPESNGKRNWTALLLREAPWDGLAGNCGGITLARGECWNRVAYEAERTRYLLGLRDTEPMVLDYGKDIATQDQWEGEKRMEKQA